MNLALLFCLVLFFVSFNMYGCISLQPSTNKFYVFIYFIVLVIWVIGKVVFQTNFCFPFAKSSIMLMVLPSSGYSLFVSLLLPRNGSFLSLIYSSSYSSSSSSSSSSSFVVVASSLSSTFDSI